MRRTNQYVFCICCNRVSSLERTIVRSNPCLSWAGSTKSASNTPALEMKYMKNWTQVSCLILYTKDSQSRNKTYYSSAITPCSIPKPPKGLPKQQYFDQWCNYRKKHANIYHLLLLTGRNFFQHEVHKKNWFCFSQRTFSIMGQKFLQNILENSTVRFCI